MYVIYSQAPWNGNRNGNGKCSEKRNGTHSQEMRVQYILFRNAWACKVKIIILISYITFSFSGYCFITISIQVLAGSLKFL